MFSYNDNEMASGVEFTYYFLCKRKLYLFSNNINFEKTNEDVRIGKIIEESYYSRSDKSKGVNDINLDKVDFKNKIIYEVKKSSKHVEIDKLQCKYYMFYLRHKCNVLIKKSIIQYPDERLNIECFLSDKDIETIENAIEDIKQIKLGTIPPVTNQSICKKCSYFEFCYI